MFDELTPESTEAVHDFDLKGLGGKGSFAALYESTLKVNTPGKYEFSLTSDDGSALEIAGKRIDNDGIHAPRTKTAIVRLDPGEYPVRVEFFNRSGGMALDVRVKGPKYDSSLAALIIAGGGPPNLLPSEFSPQESLVELGQALFASAGCASCHQFNEVGASPHPAALPLDQWAIADDGAELGGCLASEVVAPAVDYELTESQRSAVITAIRSIRAGIKSEPVVDAKKSDAHRVHMTMVSLNCYACHQRDKIGGIDQSHDSWFKSTTPEMGWEGRVPPPLDGVGDKLNDQYMASLLDEGANERSYMLTRMPGFNSKALAPFHASVNRVDRSEEIQVYQHKLSSEDIIGVGRELCGSEGLSCIKCHSFGGEKAGGLGAIDMLRMPERLRAEWFQRYLLDPIRYRPGTRMPNSFVDGKSANTKWFHAEPVPQIDSLWRFLSQGEDAKEPPGLRLDAIVLAADQRPRIYRNFFTDVSPRGIAIGYPGGVNLIWDAEQMSLARVWKNQFIDAALHWQGRGQGRQQPHGDAITSVESGASVSLLGSTDAPWPSDSARKRGWLFRGYQLDASGNPTFRYQHQVGEGQHITVLDSPLPVVDGGKSIRRRLTFDVPGVVSGEQLVWQLAAGKIEKKDDGYLVDAKLKVDVEGVDCEVVTIDATDYLRAVISDGDSAGAKVSVTETLRW